MLLRVWLFIQQRRKLKPRGIQERGIHAASAFARKDACKIASILFYQSR